MHDYKKTGPSKILKLLTCRCHHLIDMLIEFSQSIILVTHLKLSERAMPVNVYQLLHELLRTRPLLRKKIAKHPSAH